MLLRRLRVRLLVVCVCVCCEVMCPPEQSMEVLLIRDALLASVVAYIASDKHTEG